VPLLLPHWEHSAGFILLQDASLWPGIWNRCTRPAGLASSIGILAWPWMGIRCHPHSSLFAGLGWPEMAAVVGWHCALPFDAKPLMVEQAGKWLAGGGISLHGTEIPE
jgi:hypothetical protein